MIRKLLSLALAALLFLSSASAGPAWNDPRHEYPGSEKIRYHAFSEAPKTLDPARAYSSDEMTFIGQIVEPPLQYHYLKRPYELEPLTALEMPTVQYLNKDMKVLPDNTPSSQVAFTPYTIKLKSGIRYPTHPALS